MDILDGKKVFLRLMMPEDTDNIIKWRNTDFVRRNFIYQKPFTAQGHEEWTRTMINTGKAIQFIICDKNTGKSVGSVYLRDINREFRKAEYGVFIGEREALGRGYGTEAATLLTTYAFEQLRLHKVMLRVLAENIQAKRSYEKAGFVQEAYLRDEVFLEGRYRDVIYMAMLHPDESDENAKQEG